jgi:hypothetical protein
VKPSDDYDVPQGVVFVPFDLATGYRATPDCRASSSERSRTAPSRPSSAASGRTPCRRSPLPPEGGLLPEAGEPVGAEVRVDDAPPPGKAGLPRSLGESGPPG